jgi:3-deoxy-D-manno-octulosonic acid (KDO) 8-phosphate synthase
MRSAEALNSRMAPLAVDGDHAVDGGGQQGAHPGFAARQFAEQLAVAQQAVGRQDEDGEGDRDQGDRQRQEGAVRIAP